MFFSCTILKAAQYLPFTLGQYRITIVLLSGIIEESSILLSGKKNFFPMDSFQTASGDDKQHNDLANNLFLTNLLSTLPNLDSLQSKR